MELDKEYRNDRRIVVKYLKCAECGREITRFSDNKGQVCYKCFISISNARKFSQKWKMNWEEWKKIKVGELLVTVTGKVEIISSVEMKMTEKQTKVIADCTAEGFDISGDWIDITTKNVYHYDYAPEWVQELFKDE